MKGVTLPVLRTVIMSYFLLNSYIIYNEAGSHVTEFKKSYHQFETQLTKATGRKFPECLRSASVDKHAAQIFIGIVMLQGLLALLGIVNGCSGALSGVVYFVKACLIHNAFALVTRSHSLKDFEPLLRSLALVCASFAVDTCASTVVPKMVVDANKKKK